jgi:hypothetical protein
VSLVNHLIFIEDMVHRENVNKIVLTREYTPKVRMLQSKCATNGTIFNLTQMYRFRVTQVLCFNLRGRDQAAPGAKLMGDTRQWRYNFSSCVLVAEGVPQLFAWSTG